MTPAAHGGAATALNGTTNDLRLEASTTMPNPHGDATRVIGPDAAPEYLDHARVVAIDGPAAAGKTTVARALADLLGAMLFDTGTLYRAVTLAAIRAGVSFDNGPALAALADARHINVTPPTATDGRLYDVLLDGEDVTWAIRNPAVDRNVSEVSAHPEVRSTLLPVQRRIARSGPVVMVGRDIGTAVVPDAGVKIFLGASLEERARRRQAELVERGQAAGVEEVLHDLRARDAIDSGRSASPLRVAVDAIVIDTDGRDVTEIVAEIADVVRRAWVERDEAASAGGPG